MDEETALVAFQGRAIRRTWFNDEWWFAAVDIVEALTDSKDPSGYLKDMRRRDEGFKAYRYPYVTRKPIPLLARMLREESTFMKSGWGRQWTFLAVKLPVSK